MHHKCILGLLVALLTSTGVLSITVETRQIKSLLKAGEVRTHHNDKLGRLLRATKESDKSVRAADEEKPIEMEERNIVSPVLSKISEKIPIAVKKTWWEAIGTSTKSVKKKLGLENVVGPALEREKAFPHYLSYVDRIEKHGMSTNAYRHVPTTNYWEKMEKELGQQINTLKDLDAIKNTNAFRKYKRYAHTFDESMISVMGSGYHTPTNYGNDIKKATETEWWARAEIWGEYRIKPAIVEQWWRDAGLSKNYYEHYEKAFKNAPPVQTLPAREKADREALKGFMLAEGSTM